MSDVDAAPVVTRVSVGWIHAAAAGALAAGLAGAVGLWWRYGEGVYGQALLNAVIACF
jgi:hypothetical protein